MLLVIVLGPLLLFSNANPITNSHLVKSATVKLGVEINNGGTFPLGEISRITLDGLSKSDPVLKQSFYSWSCLAATSTASTI